jgi:hypothetical protein
MERILPNTFLGPRAYFTSFDYRIVKRTSNLDRLRTEVERKLKILLLLKSKIVCAASHLTSEFTYNIFKDNPYLINQGYILPAFRADKTDISELFVKKRLKNKDSVIKFYRDNIKQTVKWDLVDNSAWFKNQFVMELKDENSLIKRQLKNVSNDEIQNIINEIESVDIFSRELIDSIAKNFTRNDRALLLNFRDLIYHMSGARVVNCESALPQENYIDYDLADLSHNRTKLSDEQILWKLYFEMALETLHKKMIPIEILDILSFQDILTIRKPLLEAGFQERYDSLINKIILGMQSQSSKLLFNINELEQIRIKLKETFDIIFEEELSQFQKKLVKSDIKELGNVSSSVALGILGFIPGIGSIASALSVLKDSPSLIFNIGQSYTSLKSLSNFEDYISKREKILREKILMANISDKSLMLEAVQHLTNSMYDKLKI